jgi:aerobic-type carbon monoxide dehydrogenase small subunit (CoxS/CutS family)
MTMQTEKIEVTVNGIPYEREVETRRLASDFIRHELFLTGTHVGCEHGSCGACNILVDGKVVRSCLMLAVQLDGAEVRTIENLGTAENMHPLQEAFWEKGGLQCGFCTPGMLASAVELLEQNSNPSDAEIREAVSSNLCRCTGYQQIVESIQAAVKKIQGEVK